MGLSLLSGDAALKNTYIGRPVEQLNQVGGTMAAKKPMGKLGSGERFNALQGELARKGAKDPKALAAVLGRAKYGKLKMAQMAQAGKKKAGT